METGACQGLLMTFFNFFYCYSQRAKQVTTNLLGVGQVKCPNLSAASELGFAPQGNLYSEQFVFHFHLG